MKQPENDTSIIVTARLRFDSEESRDRAVDTTAQVQAATRDDEEGCLAYCFAADPVVPTEIQVYERWTDADSLEKHFSHANYAAMVEALRTSGGFRESRNRMHAARDRGPVYDEGGTFRRHAFEGEQG